MVLDLRQLFSENDKSIPLNAEFDLSDVEFYGGFPIKTPVKITGEILSKADIVSLSAEIKVDYTAPCDRCGDIKTKHFCFPVEKTLVTKLYGSEENDAMLVIPDKQLDINKLVMTEVVLNIPTKHLCREDCKGVCPQCGKNLNLGDCDCEKSQGDPRLAVLKQLLSDE